MTDLRRPLVVVTGRRRPHQALILAASAFIGAAHLAGAPVAPSLAALLSPPAVTVWASCLALSGAVGLVGSWMVRRIENGLLIEAGALLLNAVTIGVYATAAFAYAGARALTAGTFCALLAAANIWRAAQAAQDVREIRREVGGG